MEMASYSGGSVLRTTETGIMQGHCFFKFSFNRPFIKGYNLIMFTYYFLPVFVKLLFFYLMQHENIEMFNMP